MVPAQLGIFNALLQQISLVRNKMQLSVLRWQSNSCLKLVSSDLEM